LFLLKSFRRFKLQHAADTGGMNIQAPVSQANPRDIAAKILATQSREQRQALLNSCPEELRDLVRSHVENNFDRVKSYRAHLAARADSMRKKPPPAPRRESSFKPIDNTRSAPEVGNAALAHLRGLITGGGCGN
jgi:hypothetical protein